MLEAGKICLLFVEHQTLKLVSCTLPHPRSQANQTTRSGCWMEGLSLFVLIVYGYSICLGPKLGPPELDDRNKILTIPDP